jgi:hypothetical protein
MLFSLTSTNNDSPFFRLFALTQVEGREITLVEDSIEYINNKNWDDLSKIKKRDYTINSYISFCFRSINKFGLFFVA